jgi:hypothetical protein
VLTYNEQHGPSPSDDPALIPLHAQHIQRRDAPGGLIHGYYEGA